MHRLFERPFIRIPIPDKANPPKVEYPPEVTQRHLDEAYRDRWHELMRDGEFRHADPAWQAANTALLDERYDNAIVREIADLYARQEAVEMMFIVQLSRTMGKLDDPSPPEMDPLDNAKRFMDDGYEPGVGLRPSNRFELQRFALDNEWIGCPGVSQQQARERRERFERDVLEEARQRYRDGFYADPFTAEPRRRAAPNDTTKSGD